MRIFSSVLWRRIFFLKIQFIKKLGKILGKVCAPKPALSQWSSHIKDMFERVSTRNKVCVHAYLQFSSTGTNWSIGSFVWTWGRTSSLWGWRSPGTGCSERLWSLLLWRYSRPAWTRCCAVCCRWPCFSRGVGLDDPQRSLPTPNILWFCDLKIPVDTDGGTEVNLHLIIYKINIFRCHMGNQTHLNVTNKTGEQTFVLPFLFAAVYGYGLRVNICCNLFFSFQNQNFWLTLQMLQWMPD